MTKPDGVTALVGRERALVWLGIGVGVAAAWAYLVHRADGAGLAEMSGIGPLRTPWTLADVGFAVVMWTVMMAGMMLPAAAPAILLFAAANRTRRAGGGLAVSTVVFVLGYLAVWGAFSVGAALAQWALHAVAMGQPSMHAAGPLLGGGLLVAAGVYQLTPLKAACLARCRHPLATFLTGWRDGAAGALCMGSRHGLYCLGCCGLLMGLLFVASLMNLLWVAVITVFVLVEKVAPGGAAIGRAASVGLIGAGLVVAGAGVGT